MRGELLRRSGRALAELAGLEVLAEDAAQIAPREEDRAAAVPAAQAVFLAAMCEITAGHGVSSGPAGRLAIGQTIDAAVARAQAARGQVIDRLPGAALQFARSIQRQIGRLKFAGGQ